MKDIEGKKKGTTTPQTPSWKKKKKKTDARCGQPGTASPVTVGKKNMKESMATYTYSTS